MKQKTIRAFIVEDFNNLKNVVNSKYELVKNYYFLLKEKNEEIEKFLKEKNLNYFIENNMFTFSKEKTKEIKIIEKEKLIEKRVNTKIYDKIIRAGVEIETDENLIFLNRINAGAKIKSSGNVEIFGECEGSVICEGDYLIVKKNRGNIIFRGENIGKIDKLTIFTKSGKKELE
ncbi:septum site-determining protein MinC [Lebetimonas natsushimae]|uniref:Septum site-determining protein MinC n=1 Tax=Lebetimonas natsushimae TaxID=1936991 RepID=A0A292YC84_9BACT|nr:septum site-determining protein MinC [Lebetimonas natsushimae]GAX87103.1 septum site-determining protein MinC [Lebetimonas natsushimae]